MVRAGPAVVCIYALRHHRVMRLLRMIGIDPHPFSVIPNANASPPLLSRRQQDIAREEILRDHLRKISRDLARCAVKICDGVAGLA
jgi:hypothetical protein